MFAEVLEIAARSCLHFVPAEVAFFRERQFPRERRVSPEMGNRALPRFLHEDDFDHYTVGQKGALMRKSLEPDLREFRGLRLKELVEG